MLNPAYSYRLSTIDRDPSLTAERPVDINEQAFQCEWYFTNTLKTRDDSTLFTKGLVTQTKTNHLVEGAQSIPITKSSALSAKDKAIATKN